VSGFAGGACSGLRVLELGGGMAGPMVGMLLADNGADVVKLEPPAGDWARPLHGFAMWNRGKRSVVLDLRRYGDREAALRLAAGADVVIDSLAPGAAAALGFGPATLRAANPALVHCSITGFGSRHRPSSTRAYEGVVAAVTGRFNDLDRLNGLSPRAGRERPVFSRAPIGSYGAAQLATQAILAALIDRARTGTGCAFETSLVRGAAAFLMRQELQVLTTSPPSVPPTVHRGIELTFLTAKCADGRHIQMCARQDHHFRNWMLALGLEDVLEDPRYARAPMGIERMEDIDALEARIRERMLRRTQAEWMYLFHEVYDVGADPFLTPEEFLNHPQMTGNGRVVEVDDPTFGRVRMVGPLVLFSESRVNVGRPAPHLGEHTAEVLAEPWLAGPATGPAETSGRPPLHGFTVLELGYFIAGPLAGVLLAELGARVIKIEPPEGDPYRRTGLQAAKFLHGKESVTLDLKSDSGRTALRALVARADVLCHSFRPGVAERLGMDEPTVRAINPDLVYVYASSYGSKGPGAGRIAFHSTPNALSGAGILQAGEGNPPVDDSHPDPGAGLAVATAILLGLHARVIHGSGQYVETSMLATIGHIHSDDLVIPLAGRCWTPSDPGQHGLGVFYRLYWVGGRWLFVAAVTDADRRGLAAALGHPEWASDPGEATPDAVAAALETAGEAAKRWVAEVDHRHFDEWLRDKGFLRPSDHPAFGPHLRPPDRLEVSPWPSPGGRASSPGEHTEQVLAELALDPDR